MKQAIIEAMLEDREFCALSSLSPFLQRLKMQFSIDRQQLKLALASLL